ncbi:hypothetical protein HIM_10756 [Hirsutella minnesotensis 3608]|uniref:Uncharacterized protein n=1 Tax=Hirsutella minnesotensis 3608 TaxID=1043627 RepID=A0A0F7ZFW6_9HYPO|nr:hypothetical protein HIM_10756 [Hirsutella minnesotensis 3608]
MHGDSSTVLQGNCKDTHAATLAASIAQTNMPVTSYLAPGFHETPLPVGKDYPPNYEQQQHKKTKTHARPSVSSLHFPKHYSQPPDGEVAEPVTQRKMKQYQRDMIVQAAMTLESSATAVPKSLAGVSLSGISLKTVWLAGPLAHKPPSPTLRPLGSPGPVTPMDLESVSGGYPEHGGKARGWLFKEDSISSNVESVSRSI